MFSSRARHRVSLGGQSNVNSVFIVVMVALVAAWLLRPIVERWGGAATAARAGDRRGSEARLTWEGEGSRRSVPLRGRVISLGRGRDCAVQIEGLLVSRRHARIERDGAPGRWVLVDNGSTNGTFVNGRQISRHPLVDGDVVQIGKARLRFAASRDTNPRTAMSSRPQPASKPRHGRSSSRPSPRPSATGPASGDTTSIPGYVLHSRLDGGHGTVFHATRSQDGRECAIKVLRLTDRFLVEKFEQEMRILQAFNHPHVVRAIETGMTASKPFVVMEYCGGGNLRRSMGSGPLTRRKIVRVMGQACHGVHYAHRQRVIHRDLKPEHIMFDAKGNVKVVDFGIAKSAASLTQTSHGMVLGTPAYLSPEQARGQGVDHFTDIYALGVILYELLVGQVPFRGSNTDMLEQHIKKPLPPPAKVNPGCDQTLAAVAVRALAKSPRQRFSTAEAMANALGYRH